jgi:hypothetical protein
MESVLLKSCFSESDFVWYLSLFRHFESRNQNQSVMATVEYDLDTSGGLMEVREKLEFRPKKTFFHFSPRRWQTFWFSAFVHIPHERHVVCINCTVAMPVMLAFWLFSLVLLLMFKASWNNLVQSYNTCKESHASYCQWVLLSWFFCLPHHTFQDFLLRSSDPGPCPVRMDLVSDAERVNVVLGIYKHYPGSIWCLLAMLAYMHVVWMHA